MAIKKALKETIRDLEDMLNVRDETNKILTQTLDGSKNVDTSAKNIILSLNSEIIFLRQRFSSLVQRLMKLELTDKFIKTMKVDLERMFKTTRNDFNTRMENYHKEMEKTKKALMNYEDKKKITIREGKRRVLATDPEEAFIILTSNNDTLKKEINDKKAEISVLKKQNTELREENMQNKAELYKLASLVKAQFYGSLKQGKLKDRELRDIESQPNQSIDIEESVNWGPTIFDDKQSDPNFNKLPELKLDLDGFPGVDNREMDDNLKRGPSEPVFASFVNTVVDPTSVNTAAVDRLIRNYRRVVYHNRLLIEAYTKAHEMLRQMPKVITQPTAPKDEVIKAAINRFKRRLSLKVDERPSQEVAEKPFRSKNLSLEDSKKLLKTVNNQLKSYFEKIVQRIISPCSFLRIDERDLPEMKIKLKRAATWR